jgi:hypothetical protein
MWCACIGYFYTEKVHTIVGVVVDNFSRAVDGESLNNCNFDLFRGVDGPCCLRFCSCIGKDCCLSCAITMELICGKVG